VYEDMAGFCKSVTLEDVRKNNFILTPGRYMGILNRKIVDNLAKIELKNE